MKNRVMINSSILALAQWMAQFAWANSDAFPFAGKPGKSGKTSLTVLRDGKILAQINREVAPLN